MAGEQTILIVAAPAGHFAVGQAVNKGRATLALASDVPQGTAERGKWNADAGALTWAEIAERSERLSYGYAQLGLCAGMRDWQQTARQIFSWPAADLKLRAAAGLANCLQREEDQVIELLAERIMQDGACRFAAARALLQSRPPLPPRERRGERLRAGHGPATAGKK